MTFTVVRAVRGAESLPTEPDGKPVPLAKIPAPFVSSASMDLPRMDDLLQLDFGNAGFPDTIPDPLD